MKHRVMKHRILIAALVLAAASAPLVGSAQPGPYPHHWDHANRSTSGRIAAVSGGSFQLRSGQTVFLHQGTVINPTGITLQPGMMVAVNGSPAGDGNINADEVDVSRGSYDRNGYYDQH